MRPLRFRLRPLLLCVAAASACALAAEPEAVAPESATAITPPASDAGFCVRAQRTMAGTNMTARNVVHPDYESFKKSKATIDPLQTEQFVLYEDEARQRPLRISCKLKSPDLIAQTYGASAASDPGLSCAHLHRQIVEGVFAALTPEERSHLAIARVVYEPDETTFMGSRWIEPFEFAWRNGEALHLRDKRLRVDWNDPWFAWAPDRVRGVVYCHLIAPEHFRRLTLNGPGS